MQNRLPKELLLERMDSGITLDIHRVLGWIEEPIRIGRIGLRPWLGINYDHGAHGPHAPPYFLGIPFNRFFDLLYPTFCELAGIEPEHPLSGKSLVPRLKDPRLPGKEWELTELARAMSLRTERYRYTKLGKEAMLYDLQNDPNEWHNLAGKTEYMYTETRLNEILESLDR